MEYQEAKQLLQKYRENACTEEELAMLESWYLKYELEGLQPLSLAEWAIIDQTKAPKVKKAYKLWPRIAAAAAVLLVISAGVLFYKSRPIVNRNSEIVNQNDIAPGRNTATITLANGKTISLSDAKTGVVVGANKLAYNDGSLVGRHPEFISGSRTGKEEKQGRDNVKVQTPRGGQYQITLPDGTKVWLNAASSLSFPSAFQGLGNRKVELSGEAYFEVAKDKSHPFIVETSKQEVEVLGTHFNVYSYADEPNTNTTLLEGSVRVISLASQEIVNRKPNIVTLLPNQQATLTSNAGITVKKVEAEDAIAWKNGLFMFDSESLESIMKKISRWYNVDVLYNNALVKKEIFSGSVSKFSKVSGVLKQLENTGPVTFKIEARKIIVSTAKQ